MKNKIIKIVCFSLLALSVALCAVFAFPKKDNLKVNALPNINMDNDTYFPIIPYNALYAYDVSLPQVGITVSKSIPLFTTDYLDIDNTSGDAYVLNSSQLVFGIDFNYTPLNVVDNQTLRISRNLFITIAHEDGLTIQCSNLGLSAFDFVLPIFNNNDLSAYSTLNFVDTSNLSAYTCTYTINLQVDFVINGDFIENEYIRLTGNSELAQVHVYNYIRSYFRNNYLFNDVLYVYVRDLNITLNFDRVIDFGFLYFELASVSYNSYQNDLNVISYYDSFETTKIEYELNLFQTLIRTVHEFMSTEFLPNVSFYDLLLYVLVIPLVIMLLKMWLGG